MKTKINETHMVHCKSFHGASILLTIVPSGSLFTSFRWNWDKPLAAVARPRSEKLQVYRNKLIFPRGDGRSSIHDASILTGVSRPIHR